MASLRFSLVIPNYNSGVLLERAVASILSQQYANLQLILSDSASSDLSSAIIDRYLERFDVVFREMDAGQVDGLNRGFGPADGDIFGWLCADDELTPGALFRVAEIFANHPEADVVIGGCERVFADGSRSITPADPQTWDKIGMIDVVAQPSTFWRARLHRRIGKLATDFRLAFDCDLWCRMRDAGAGLVTRTRCFPATTFRRQTNRAMPVVCLSRKLSEFCAGTVR